MLYKLPKYHINEIYTDSSLRRSRLGVGIWNKHDKIEQSYKLSGLLDINRGELAAIFIAMLSISNKKDISIISDSETALSIIRDKKDTCKDKYKILNNSVQFLKSSWKGDISFHKIKGHSGNIGNDYADKLAGMATNDNCDDNYDDNCEISKFILPDELDISNDYKIDIADVLHTIRSLNNI